MSSQPDRQDYPDDGQGRPFSELRDTGLLWLINRTVFHPRGYALALVVDEQDGSVHGWELQGDGSEVWRYDPEIDEDEMLALVRRWLP